MSQKVVMTNMTMIKKTLHPQCLTLKKIRESRGLSQIDLAIELQKTGYTNIDNVCINRFERGKQKPWGNMILLLCQLFKMNERELFPELFIKN